MIKAQLNIMQFIIIITDFQLCHYHGKTQIAKTKFLISKISFNKRYLLHTYICYTLLLPFQKAGTCLDAQQSMAK